MTKEIIQSIERRVGHTSIQLVTRCNAAIFVSLMQFGNKVFAPKEGGWLTYSKFAKALKKEYVEIKTNDAKIDLDDLEKKVQKGGIFIYHSMGGYCAPQEIQKIYEICKKKECLVVMDVCGSFGTTLCNGMYADICVGSFGKWKIVDFGHGGFISFKDKDMYQKCKPFLDAMPFYGDTNALLYKIDMCEERIDSLLQKRRQILKDLEKHNILYSEEPLGFVVIVKFRDELERFRIVGYCTKNNLEYTLCPREIRVMDDAISIEVKRL